MPSTTETPRRRAAITGASGYLGRCVAARFAAQGWRLVDLGRREAGTSGAQHVPFQLGEPVAAERLVGIDALVHCAWDFQQRSEKDIKAINVHGSELLFEAAATAGVPRLVHISTVSASGTPRSAYGRAKLLTERMAAERGGVAIRPGLLYGRDPGGMVGMLTRLVDMLPVVPVLVGDSPPLFLAHEDDVSMLVERAADGTEGTAGQVLVAASRDPHSLRAVLGAIASARGRRRAFVRVPWQAVYLALRGAEALHLPLPMRSDSALSIGTLDPEPFASAAAPKSVSFRNFEPAALRAGLLPRTP